MINTKSRVTSILKANNLDTSITGLKTFSLSELIIASELDFQLPTNLRLGHLVEAVVSRLIKLSTNFTVLYENVQFLEHKKTIGEIDFLIAENNTNQLVHMELAYKFYLFDPDISSETLNNWIGPNRNDTLKKKLDKVKNKQFPLLFHESAKSKFCDIDTSKVSQKLCLLVSLFIPHGFNANFDSNYQEAIKGYYLDLDTFISLDHSNKRYYLPPKREWGINPSENASWSELKAIDDQLSDSINQKQALLCWQKFDDSYASFFIVWW